MYVCAYVCMSQEWSRHICMYVRIYVCMSEEWLRHVCMYVRIYVCMSQEWSRQTQLSIYMHARAFIYMYISGSRLNVPVCFVSFMCFQFKG